MKVVNIVPVEMFESAKMKMFAADDWSLQRLYEEVKVVDHDIEYGEGHNEVDSDIDRQRRSMRASDTFKVEEEEQEEEEDVQDPQGEHAQQYIPQDNLLHDLGL